MSGFKKSGICPFNPDKFSERDFAAAREINVQPISVEIMDVSVNNLDSPGQTKAFSEGNGSRPNLSQQIEPFNNNSKSNVKSLYDNPTPSTSIDNFF